MVFNDYLGPLVNVECAISISTISLVDVDVGNFSPYICVPTPWAKYTKTTVRGASSLGNLSCSKLYFSPSLTVAVAAALPVRSCSFISIPTFSFLFVNCTMPIDYRCCMLLFHVWYTSTCRPWSIPHNTLAITPPSLPCCQPCMHVHHVQAILWFISISCGI